MDEACKTPRESLDRSILERYSCAAEGSIEEGSSAMSAAASQTESIARERHRRSAKADCGISMLIAR